MALKYKQRQFWLENKNKNSPDLYGRSIIVIELPSYGEKGLNYVYHEK
jgi:hypothetical protein